MKLLLLIMAIFELVTGVGLEMMPSKVVSIMLGVSLTESAGKLCARIAGFALISLSLACWYSRNEMASGQILIKCMIIYNIGVIAILLFANLKDHFSGIGLWPALVSHAALAGWCFQCILQYLHAKNK